MKGYFKEEEKTRDVIKDGWFYSGDLGYFDEKGEVHVAERKAECISSGGEKIYPQEVEEVLLSNPKVEEVCVIGVPDPEWGESVRVVVKLKEGETATPQEIMDWCRGKVTGYKRPKSVVFVDSLPLTPVGKVLRRVVKEKYGKP
jgi:acyl-CoA synthetase (AMP-forming)/AMP-acid ligase II